ncbi:MAG: hypothetical protein ACLQVJ_02665, partial [Syntrophobacteraceae bacterium]
NKTELPSAAPEVAPSEERCADLHAPRGAALCLTRLRVWQKSRGRGGKSPALLVSSILNATRYDRSTAGTYRWFGQLRISHSDRMRHLPPALFVRDLGNGFGPSVHID